MRSVEVNGETIRVGPLKIGQIPAFLRAIAPVLRQLSSPEIDWPHLLGQHGDDLLEALAIALGKSREWVDARSVDEAILLAAQVIEVNAEFLTRTVIPVLDGLFLGATPQSASTLPAAE